MKYIMNKNCQGNFILQTTINLDDYLNHKAQEKFVKLREKDEEDLTDEEFEWLEKIYEIFSMKQRKYPSIIVDYEISDYDWTTDMDEVIE